jgi:hypothetical protein
MKRRRGRLKALLLLTLARTLSDPHEGQCMDVPLLEPLLWPGDQFIAQEGLILILCISGRASNKSLLGSKGSIDYQLLTRSLLKLMLSRNAYKISAYSGKSKPLFRFIGSGPKAKMGREGRFVALSLGGNEGRRRLLRRIDGRCHLRTLHTPDNINEFNAKGLMASSASNNVFSGVSIAFDRS